MPPASIAAAVSGGFSIRRKMFTRIRAIQKELRSAKGNNDTLAWIHRTEQPIEEIRIVIEKTIPKRLKK